jgi:hypothetical protein
VPKEWKKFESKDYEARRIIHDRVEMLAAVFSRKVSEELIHVYQEALAGYPAFVLRSAFVKAERELDKMPTPKTMRWICNDCMPSQNWKNDLIPSTAMDGDREVQVLLDPSDGSIRYRPQDCQEGREFLALLRKIAGKAPPREPGDET